MRHHLPIEYGIAALVCVVSGCGLMPARNPVAAEDRHVKSVATRDKEVVLKEAIVWFDRHPNATRGIRFPEGTYKIEAEDDEYYYFAAPKDIEYRVFRDGKVVDGRFMPGGLFLGKVFLKAVPAGAYLSVDERSKVVTWHLGGNFLRLEGKKWTRNY